MEKKIKEGIHLKKKKRFVKQKISGKIFVLMGLAIILAIAAKRLYQDRTGNRNLP